jgi:hypothetical protein
VPVILACFEDLLKVTEEYSSFLFWQDLAPPSRKHCFCFGSTLQKQCAPTVGQPLPRWKVACEPVRKLPEMAWQLRSNP